MAGAGREGAEDGETEEAWGGGTALSQMPSRAGSANQHNLLGVRFDF